MKKIFLLISVIICIFYISGCTDENTDGNSDNNKKTILAINNQSDVNIVNVNYASVDFGSISKGETSDKEVSQGTRYIYFSIKINNDSIDCRTDVVTCDEGQNTNFNMTNNTTIVETAGDTRTTIKNLYNTLSSFPTNFRVSTVTENSISFLWNEVNGASGYNIYRATSQNGNFIKLNLNLLSNTEFSDLTTSTNVVYWYAVSSMINAIETAKTEALPAVTLIPAPDNLQMNSSTLSSINLTWNIVNGVSGYNVYRASSENGNYTKVNTALITSGTYTDIGLTSNTIYFYKVCAVVSIMEGAFSNPVSASTLIPAPVELRASAITNDSISIAWNSLNHVIGYNVYRSLSEFGTYTKINSDLIPNTEYTDNSVSSNTTYYYKVNAVTSSIESMQSIPIPASTGIVVDGSDLNAKLNWLDTNAVSNTRYVIELTSDEFINPRSLGGGKNGIIITVIGKGMTFDINLTSDGYHLFNIYDITLVLNNVFFRGRNRSVVCLNSGTMIMNGGSRICNGNDTRSGYGGGVTILGGKFIMNGGEICNNITTIWDSSYHSGGGIYISKNGIFIMNNGKIYSNNATSGNGVGGVGKSDGGIFIMKDGEIFGNHGYRGGGILGNEINMSGGVIYGNNAELNFRNTSNVYSSSSGSAALAGSLQYGTFVGDTFFRAGEIKNGTDDTIRIVDGVLFKE